MSSTHPRFKVGLQLFHGPGAVTEGGLFATAHLGKTAAVSFGGNKYRIVAEAILSGRKSSNTSLTATFEEVFFAVLEQADNGAKTGEAILAVT